MNLRLSTIEYSSLIKISSMVNGEMFVFGSRTDLKKKGGDIDLLIYSTEDSYTISTKIKTQFYILCDESIDVMVINKEKIEPFQLLFLSTIHPIKLK